MKNAEQRCEYCQCREDYSMDYFEFDHIIPISKGGSTTLDNLAYACGGCNSLKSDKLEVFDTATQQSVALFHPRKQQWNDHFRWSEDGTLIIGTTLIGRVTLETLQMNRPNIVRLRKVWIILNIHPPKAL